MGAIKVEKLEVGMLGTNCYLVFDDETKEGYVIDPGADARGIDEAVRRSGMKPLGILCTHGHMDHVGAAGKLAEALRVPVYISKGDSSALTGALRGIRRLESLVVSKPGGGVEPLEGGDALPFGDHSLVVALTPGHTTGSVSFITDDRESIFCGDLVFQGSIGRTDLRGGSLAQLVDAVRREVWVLPDPATIFPGHGPATTVGTEKRYNPFLSGLEEGA